MKITEKEIDKIFRKWMNDSKLSELRVDALSWMIIGNSIIDLEYRIKTLIKEKNQ